MYINLMNRYIRAKYNVQNPEIIFNNENNTLNEVNRTATQIEKRNYIQSIYANTGLFLITL